MKKTIAIILGLLIIGAIAYGISLSRGQEQKVAVDPCAVDFKATLLIDVPNTLTEEDVARTILTQYLEGLKALSACPAHVISDYVITYVGNVKHVESNFMVDAKFDVKPTFVDQFVLDTPETTADGEWVRGKQATLGVIRAEGSSTSTASYRLAI